ncbi:hypothetical protein DQQ10_00920 [Pseudochryseolinea flava]|uniref:Uncharacterized protein n=1 Tax=Pseudochryseolinea flava TaxID=2059302 RepID=A0A364Y8Y5_9BACT|nr:hypothetical protein DQQ10_00920 [Pseudochryseolinea flava]
MCIFFSSKRRAGKSLATTFLIMWTYDLIKKHVYGSKNAIHQFKTAGNKVGRMTHGKKLRL